MSDNRARRARQACRSPPDPTYRKIRHIPLYGGFPIYWKDYAHDNQTKAMTLHAVEFIRRFLLHVLPTGFVRIRQFGFLANRLRKKRLALCRNLLGAQSPAMHASSDSPTRSDPKIEEECRQCPVCNAGRLIVVQLLKPEEMVK